MTLHRCWGDVVFTSCACRDTLLFGKLTLNEKQNNTILSAVCNYTIQNNLRPTSFIFPLIITKMRPSRFKIISWAKLEVSALFQSAQHVCNVFSYKSVNGTNNARPNDSKKNGNFQKTIFYPKMKFFHNTGKILCLMKTIICHTQKSCKLSLPSSKRHTDMARKRGQPFERLRMPRNFSHRQQIICSWYR